MTGARIDSELPEQGKHRAAPVRSVVRVVAELTSLTTIVAFLLSAMIYTFAFSRLGLEYLEYASLEDVVRAGVALLIHFIVLGFAATVFLVPLGFVLELCSGVVKSSAVLLLALLAVALPMIFPVYFTEHDAFEMLRATVVVMALPILIAVIVAGVPTDNLLNLRSLRESYGRVGAFLRAPRLWYLIASLAALFAVSSSLQRAIAEVRDVKGYAHAGEGEFGPGCRIAQVIWIGTQSAILACQNGVFAVRGYENLQMSVGKKFPCKRVTSEAGRYSCFNRWREGTRGERANWLDLPKEQATQSPADRRAN
jgi:hypothetical protein